MASAASMPVYLLPGAPVHQPSHLEGDASLATEILPGPPPLVSAQQSTQKRDPRKSSIGLSYLPPSDPGSTYSGLMHGAALISQELEGSRTKRTRVDKSSTTGRAQRASARHQNGALSATLDPVLLVETHTPNKVTLIETDAEMIQDDEPTFSRSTSSLNLPEPLPTTRNRRKDKGKAKDKETMVKVKEEPKSISLLSPEPTGNLLHNDDHCSSCRSQGSLIYCDGCPRAFHLWCLDPPMEHIDEGDSRWYCPSCTIKKNPPRKPEPSLLAALVHHVETSIPTEFQLPDEVRSFFKDVGTGPKGAYIDISEVKQPKLNRHGQLEDREPHRLRDRNGTPILCFRCGASALPLGVAATGPAAKRARRSASKAGSPDSWRSMISCDYCNLHWHLDCLDPPLSAMPPFNKKWMCPNHAERVLPFKRRLPKQNAPPIEITGPRQFNNGNIEVIHPEAAPIHTPSKMVVDEVLINGRRYRVPERILVLDFWNKISLIKNPIAKDLDNGSGLSSPLTSLSSLDDLDEPPETQTPDPEALRVAQTLCLFKAGQGSFKPAKKVIDIATQTGEESDASSRMHPARMARLPTINKRATKTSNANGTTRPGVTSNPEPTSVYVPVVRRRRSAVQVLTEPSTRELRPRSKHESSLTSLSSRNSQKRAEDSGQDSAIQDAGTRSKPVNIKLEESDFSPLIASIPSSDAMQSLSANPIKPTTIVVRRARTRRTSQKEPDDGRKIERERRGRKRKERDDEVPEKSEQEVLSGNSSRPEPEKRGRDKADEVKRVSRAPPRRQSQSSPLTSVVSHPAAALLPTSIPSAPTAPSLKIRLPPRLSNTRPSNGSPKLAGAISSANDTPSKL